MSKPGKPRRRTQRRPILRLAVGIVVGLAAGFAAHHWLDRLTRASPAWLAELEGKQPDTGWDTLDLSERLYPKSVAAHHERWFVVSRAPRELVGVPSKALPVVSEKQRDWYFIDPQNQKIVGPWQPQVEFKVHGFHPSGMYVGLGQRSFDRKWVLVTFDPDSGDETARILTDRPEYEEGSSQYMLSADCETLFFADVAWNQPLRLRRIEVSTGSRLFERTFPNRGGSFRPADQREPYEGGNLICILSPNGRYFAIGDAAGTDSGIMVLDARSGTTLHKFGSVPVDGSESLAISTRWGRRLTTMRFDKDEHNLAFSVVGGGVRARRYQATCSLITGKVVSGNYLSDDPTASDGPPRSDTDISRYGEPHAPNRAFRTQAGVMEGDVYGVYPSGADYLIVNMANDLPGRQPRIPFARGALDALGLDPAGEPRRVQSMIQINKKSGTAYLVRQLSLASTDEPRVVAVRSGHVCVVIQKDDGQLVEAWPLPQSDAPWAGSVAWTAGLLASAVVLVRKR